MFALLLLILTLTGTPYQTFEDCSIRLEQPTSPAIAGWVQAWHVINDSVGC